jgi:hypothetical protein
MSPKVNDEMILCVTTTQFSRSHTLTSPPIGLEGWGEEGGGGTGTTLKQDNELRAGMDGSTGGLNPGATLSCV